jgi:hypothetical protein
MHELAEQAQQVCVYDCVFDGCGIRQQLKCLTVVDVALQVVPVVKTDFLFG